MGKTMKTRHQTPKPKRGSKLKTWFSGEPDGMSTVLKVVPYYSSVFPGMFDWTLTLTAPHTGARQIDMCI